MLQYNGKDTAIVLSSILIKMEVTVMEKVIAYLETIEVEAIKEEIHKLSTGENGWVDLDHLLDHLEESLSKSNKSHPSRIEIELEIFDNLNIFETRLDGITEYIRIRKDVENNSNAGTTVMEQNDKVNLSEEEIIEKIRELSTSEDGWIGLVNIGKNFVVKA